MNETSRIQSKSRASQEGRKYTFQTSLRFVSTWLIILSLGMAFLLPMGWAAASSTQVDAAPTNAVTLENTTDTSAFNTPNDPTDDSIIYKSTGGDSGSDSFMYEICDSVAVCVQATVNITINTSAAALVEVEMNFDSSIPNVVAGSPTANNDNATVIQNGWVNINVLDNDDFGTDGPSSSAITVSTPPNFGTATVSDGPRSPDPAGITFMSTADMLLISDSEVDELYPPNLAAYTGKNLFVTDRTGALDSTLTAFNPPDVTFTNEPTGVAYNPNNDFLYFTDDNVNRIYELDPGGDGKYNTGDDVVRSYDTDVSPMNCFDPSGITYDGNRGHLFVVDDVGEEVHDVDLGPNGKLDQSDSVTSFDVTALGIRNPEGIEFNPDNNHLYILSSKTFDRLIGETTIDGKLLRYLDITAANAVNPAGLALAPASDGSPQKNLYIVARGVDNNTDPLENDGKMYEVSFPLNAPPAVYAGPDQLVTYPSGVALDGTVEDDGLPVPPGLTTTLWTVTSGPGIVTFGDASLVDTTATFSTAGIYVLRLTASDGANWGSFEFYDELTVTVNPPGNQPPQVDAGPPQQVSLPNSAILDGTVTDDGLPNPPATYTVSWSMVSGPGLVTFGNATLEDTTASFSAAGVYVLRLTAFDSVLSAFDDVPITVNPPGNQPPNVNAGPDQTVSINGQANLNGTVTDDGLPNPPGAYTSLWSKISGPGVVTFGDATKVDTTATFSVEGEYVLRLTANDSEKSAFDDIKITVVTTVDVYLPIILYKP